jgi:hypothetical protein
MCLQDAVPECLRPGLESARRVPETGDGRKLTFCADGEVRPCCGDTFHCHDVNACWQRVHLGSPQMQNYSEEDPDQQGEEKAVRGT